MVRAQQLVSYSNCFAVGNLRGLLIEAGIKFAASGNDEAEARVAFGSHHILATFCIEFY